VRPSLQRGMPRLSVPLRGGEGDRANGPLRIPSGRAVSFHPAGSRPPWGLWGSLYGVQSARRARRGAPSAALGLVGAPRGCTGPRHAGDSDVPHRLESVGDAAIAEVAAWRLPTTWDTTPAASTSRRFFIRYAARLARVGEQPDPGSRGGPGPRGLDVMASMRTATRPEGPSLLVVRGWVSMAGVPSRSEAEAGG